MVDIDKDNEIVVVDKVVVEIEEGLEVVVVGSVEVAIVGKVVVVE